MKRSEGNVRPEDHAADIEQLLQAIQTRTSGEIREWMDSDAAQPRPRPEATNPAAGCELADAFELDIHDYSSNELNR
ncbi:DUF2525 domain-containing protein [[Erwinia] mediterraneensis]|uniref:DUF2525 domain-containing protein n=1 Tax=[Erwinia] mediterraneensis TaxID=2161819 RepID=UPI001F2ECEF6|nr:DUF2525 domain-containing protein [[Erwinia] mediterraneensis]